MLKENHTFSMTILSYPTFTVSAAALFLAPVGAQKVTLSVCVSISVK